MSIKLEDIEIGSIVLINGKLAIVDEISSKRPANPIAYKNNTDHRGYVCSLSQITAIMGVVNIDVFETYRDAVKVPKEKVDDAWAMPAALREMGVKAGDQVKILTRGKTHTVTYTGYNANRPKNPISFEMNGRQYKGPVSLIVRKVMT